jgi:CubicO group peptidase (beta-lactamase class C family)
MGATTLHRAAGGGAGVRRRLMPGRIPLIEEPSVFGLVGRLSLPCLWAASLLTASASSALVSQASMAATAPAITTENWYWGPGNRWSYKNTRRVFPSATIDRGAMQIVPLEYAVRDLDGVVFTQPGTSKRVSIAQMYALTETDGFLVLKDGKIVTERYFNGMRPQDTHLLMSVSKSVIGVLAGILVEQGRLDPQALITHYVPELSDSAYAGATVRQLLDMTVGMEFDENYASKSSDLYRLDEAAGWVPRGPNASPGIHAYLPSLKKQLGVHGSVFRYVSANVDLMGWVLERATQTDFAELVATELWSKLGTEHDAYVLLDGFQAAYADAGLNTTLRDLGRFAQMMLQNGVYGGRRVVPDEWIQDIRHAGDPQAWKASPAYPTFKLRSGYQDGAYRSYWYVADQKRGHFSAIGLAGQLIVIDPASRTVIVKFSSHASPTGDQEALEYAGAVAIIDALSGHGP